MSVNKCILIGHLGQDPELRYTPSGAAVASFSLATSEKFKGNDGQQNEKVEWHTVIVWRQLAEICAKYLHKGKQVYIEGRIETRKWEKDGVTHYKTEIIADQMRMLGGKEREAGQSAPPARRPPAAGQTSPEEPPFNESDEIPF